MPTKYPFQRAKALGWAYGEALTSAQMNVVDDNASQAADGAIWTDVAVVKNWPYSKDFSALLAGTTGVTALLWDSSRKRWNVFSYDGTDNPIGQYAQDGFGISSAANGWTAHTIPAGATLRPICAATNGSGVLLIGGTTIGASGSKIRETSDGLTWTARSVATVDTSGVRSIVWHSGQSAFVAVIDAATATNIETSPNGQTWTQVTGLPNSHARGSIASNGTTLVCVAHDTITDRCLTSTTGATGSWTERTLPTSEKWLGVAWDSVYQQFVAIGYTNVAYSSDGTTWTSAGAHSLSIAATYRMAMLGRIFLVINGGDDIAAGYVASGALTVKNVFQVPDLSIRSLACGNGQVAAGGSSEFVYFSLAGGSL